METVWVCGRSKAMSDKAPTSDAQGKRTRFALLSMRNNLRIPDRRQQSQRHSRYPILAPDLVPNFVLILVPIFGTGNPAALYVTAQCLRILASKLVPVSGTNSRGETSPKTWRVRGGRNSARRPMNLEPCSTAPTHMHIFPGTTSSALYCAKLRACMNLLAWTCAAQVAFSVLSLACCCLMA